MSVYVGAAGKSARYLGSRADADLYVGASLLWPLGDIYLLDAALTAPSATLSNGGKTATFGNSSGYQFARMAHPVYGRAYFEVTINTRGSGNIGIGLGNALTPRTATEYLRFGAGYYSYGPNIFIGDGAVGVNFGTAFVVNMVLCCDYDAAAQTIRFRQNGGSWSTAYSTASIGRGLFLFLYQSAGNGGVMTVNTGQSAFAYAVPSGAAAPDPANIPNGTDYTFGTVGKSTNVALSNGNRTAAISSGTGGFGGVHTASALKATGKYFWEYTINAGGDGLGLGFCSELPIWDGGAYIWIGAEDGHFAVWRGFNHIADLLTGISYGAGDVIGLGADMDAGTFRIRRNNGAWSADTAHGLGRYIYPSFIGFNTGESATINCGQVPFVYAVPAGYVAANA